MRRLFNSCTRCKHDPYVFKTKPAPRAKNVVKSVVGTLARFCFFWREGVENAADSNLYWVVIVVLVESDGEYSIQ